MMAGHTLLAGSCEHCPAPATVEVADLIEIQPENGFRRWAVESRHPYCAGHDRKPLHFMLDGRVEVWEDIPVEAG